MKIIFRSDKKFSSRRSTDFFFNNFCIKDIDKEKKFFSNKIFFAFITEKVNVDQYYMNLVKKKKAIINLYENYGLNYLIKIFENNCTFLIIDLKKNFLFINNDVFGTAPLYYYKKSNNDFIISDQIKCILEECKYYRFNEDFLKKFSFSHYRYIEWNNETPIKNIKKIPLAHFLKVKLTKNFAIKSLELKKWKEFNYKIDLYTEKNLLIKNKILNHLKSSIVKEINNLDDTLFSLSGGIDSSSLVALTKKMFPEKKIQTATITYDDKTYNEKDEVRNFLNFFDKKKIIWHNIKISSKNIDQKIIKHCSSTDYPYHTVTWFVDAIFKEEIKKRGFKNYVSGLGGDQLNAGEYDYFHYFFADLMKKRNYKKLEYEINSWIKNHNHPIFKKNLNLEIIYIKRQLKNKYNFFEKEKIFKYFEYSLKDISVKFLNSSKSNSYLVNKTLNEINFEMLPVCLISDFNNSKFNNIKNIYPYLDYDHFNTMLSASNSLKIDNGVQKTLFRDTFKEITPKYNLKKIRKTGWNAPSHLWLSDKYTSLLNDIFSSQDFKECGLYDTKKIKKLYENHNKIINNNQQKENHMMFFWQLASINIWKNSVKKSFS